MSKRALVSLAVPFVVAPLAACVVSISGSSCSLSTIHGSGVAASESRDVPAFSKVEVRGSADIVAQVGGATSLSLVGDDNLLPYVTTAVQGDTLVIDMQSGNYSMETDLVVTLSTPRLQGLSVLGSSDCRIDGLAGGDLELSISGSGDVHASGQVERLAVSIRGSGDMRLEQLETRSASVSISGSGDVRLFAVDALDVGITGSGDVSYVGSPAVSQHISGSGSVRRN
jgi:hypothetical protein